MDETAEIMADWSSDESRGEEESVEMNRINEILLEEGDQSEDEEDIIDEGKENEQSCDDDSENIIGKDGTIWKELKLSRAGRRDEANILRGNPGPRKRVSNAYDAFKKFVDEKMMREILRCTNEHAKSQNIELKLNIDELEKFIALQILRGFYNKNLPSIYFGIMNMVLEYLDRQWPDSRPY